MDTGIHIIVAGGGLCGLATAIALTLEKHRVTVIESAPRLHETGAGLQITPNGARLLERWGVTAHLAHLATVAAPAALSILRFDGRLLAHREAYGDELRARYGVATACLHRCDLQAALAARAHELGVEVRCGARVRDVVDSVATNEVEVEIEVVDGGASAGELELERMRADAAVAADGVWSQLRDRVLRRSVSPEPTGDLAYRILLDLDSHLDAAILPPVVRAPGIRIWAGPRMHAVAYSVRGQKLWNLVLVVPDDLPDHVARATGHVDEMRALFRDWDPRYALFPEDILGQDGVLTASSLQSLLEHVDRVDKWRLMHLPPLERWTSESMRCALAGDACHAMLPYMAQGSNIAFEDAAVLGAVFADVRDPAAVPAALAAYETIRAVRVNAIKYETVRLRREWHLPDGDAQVERDSWLARSFEKNDSTWSHPRFQPWLYGYDAYEDAKQSLACPNAYSPK